MLEYTSRYGAYLLFPTTNFSHRQIGTKSYSHIPILSGLYYSLAYCLEKILDLEMPETHSFNVEL